MQDQYSTVQDATLFEGTSQIILYLKLNLCQVLLLQGRETIGIDNLCKCTMNEGTNYILVIYVGLLSAADINTFIFLSMRFISKLAQDYFTYITCYFVSASLFMRDK